MTEPLPGVSARVPPQVSVDPQVALQQLGRMLLGDKSLAEVLHEVCRLAVASVPEVDQVSITLVEADRTRTAAFSGSLAAALDERQYEDGFGPCLGAARSGGVVRLDDTAADTLYPGFSAVARRQGVTSVLALGLPMPAGMLGGLTLYRLRGERPFSAQTEEAAAAFGAYAAVALANAARLARADRTAAQMREAMASRAVIEQAKGIVMQLGSCDGDEAFQILSRHSQRTNRPLRDIATDVTTAAARGERPNLPRSPT